MTPPVYLKTRCHYCSKWRLPHEILTHPGGVVQCLDCYQDHHHALLALSGLKVGPDGKLHSSAPPPFQCSECGKSSEELTNFRSDNDKGTVTMVLHWENGAYRFMCKQCSGSYVPKRRDLYGETEYGSILKLK